MILKKYASFSYLIIYGIYDAVGSCNYTASKKTEYDLEEVVVT
jgi:hypothetical protein